MTLPPKLEKMREELFLDTLDYINTSKRRISTQEIFYSGFTAACEVLLPEIEKLREALEFYKKGKHWTIIAGYGERITDGGEHAKQALAQLEEKLGKL